MKYHITLNQIACLFNYPLYIFTQLIFQDELYYALVSLICIFLKVILHLFNFSS